MKWTERLLKCQGDRVNSSIHRCVASNSTTTAWHQLRSLLVSCLCYLHHLILYAASCTDIKQWHTIHHTYIPPARDVRDCNNTVYLKVVTRPFSYRPVYQAWATISAPGEAEGWCQLRAWYTVWVKKIPPPPAVFGHFSQTVGNF